MKNYLPSANFCQFATLNKLICFSKLTPRSYRGEFCKCQSMNYLKILMTQLQLQKTCLA